MVYGDIVLWAIFGPIALVATLFTIRAVLGWTGLGREALGDYAYRKDQAMIDPSVDQDRFVSVYRRVNAPRVSTYSAIALWSILLATPVIAKIMEVLLDAMWQAAGRPRSIEPGYLVWAFMIFFGLFASWAGIAYLVARQYHRRTPGRLEDELKR